MNKIKIVLILIIAVLGALLIHNHFEKERIENPVPNKLQNEYIYIEDEIVFKNKNIDEAINLISSGTGIVFMCTPKSEWCQYYAKFLNDVVIEKNINEIYHLDIKEERSLETNKYQKLSSLLSDYLLTDDVGNKRINMPDIVFVKNGKIIANDNETSVVTSELNPSEYWTDKKIYDLKYKLFSYIDLLNKEEVIENIIDGTINNENIEIKEEL